MARTEVSAAARQGFQSVLSLPRARRPLDNGPVIDLTESRETRPILIIHSSDDMYGADRMVLEVIGALSAEDRDRVIVWLPTDYEHGPTPLCERLAAGGITCEHVPLPILRRRYLNAGGLSAMSGRVFETRRRLAMLNPTDIILATSAVLPIAPFLRRGSTRVFLHLQEVWQGREGRVLGGLAARVDRIIAISEASKASLPPQLQERTVVVPNGTAEPKTLVPLGDHSGEVVFVTASRWNTWKGHEVLIKAWDTADCPGRLIILGGPPVMGAAVDVRAMVAASRRPETIEVRGEVEDAGAVINDADVMIVPSTQPEPFGLVTIEAFARGRPVVASANGGLLETVRGGAGWLVEAGDVSALAERLGSLTRSEVSQAGDSARMRYEELYSRRAFRTAMSEALGAGEPRRSIEEQGLSSQVAASGSSA
jgi:glycosyltransferase involved in cell wall biosynthesis